MNYKLFTAVVALAGTVVVPVAADSVSEFYKGKQVTYLIGSAPGGGYDAYGRAVGRHLGNNIPGSPSVIVKNMPGSGSLKMTNHLYNRAKKDGTELGAPQNGVAFEPLFHLLSPGGKTALFDGTKFNWIGSANEGVYLLVAWHDAKVQKFEDLKTTELLVGSSGANTDNSILAQVLNSVFNTKLKVVTGYKGSRGVTMAMEQGEVKGASGMAYASLKTRNPHWINEKKINILLQMGIDPNPELKNVPFVLDIAENEDDRKVLEVIFAKYKMSRPIFAPPGVPAERVAALRAAFLDTMKDPAFMADAKKQRLEINPVSGERIQELVAQMYKTPEALLQRVRAALGSK